MLGWNGTHNRFLRVNIILRELRSGSNAVLRPLLSILYSQMSTLSRALKIFCDFVNVAQNRDEKIAECPGENRNFLYIAGRRVGSVRRGRIGARDIRRAQEWQIFFPAVLADGHDGMAEIVKNEDERGRNFMVTICDIPSNQLSVPDQPLGSGVIIVIGHTFSIADRHRNMCWFRAESRWRGQRATLMAFARNAGREREAQHE